MKSYYLCIISQVVLGTATLFTGGTRTYADTVTLHSDYDPDTLANDIGIIKMENYVYFDSKLYNHNTHRWYNYIAML